MNASNLLLRAAAALAAFTALLHAAAGTAEIHQPLLASALPPAIRLLLYACWHLVTVMLALSALALIRGCSPARRREMQPLLRFIGCLWMLSGLVFVAVALVFAGPAGLLTLPQWTLLIPVGMAAWAGSRGAARSEAAAG